ncbi:hypothetical protein Tco_0619650 [Tanacetum coccineum]
MVLHGGVVMVVAVVMVMIAVAWWVADDGGLWRRRWPERQWLPENEGEGELLHSSFYEPEPQPQLLPNCPSLDVSLGDKRVPEPPIKPHSPDSFRMKEVDSLTIHTPPSPHMASFHPKDMYCYYHPCIDDPKKHYGFKPGLLGQSGTLGVDFSKLKTVEDDWELGFKEVSFLGRGLSSIVRPKEVKKVRIKETHHSEHIIQQPNFQHVTPYHHNESTLKVSLYHYPVDFTPGVVVVVFDLQVIFDEKKSGSS